MDREKCKDLLQKLEWKNMLPFDNLRDGTLKLVDYSIFDNLSNDDINEYLSKFTIQDDSIADIDVSTNEKCSKMEVSGDNDCSESIIIDRIKGSLCGLAIGDAVGGPLELSSVISTKAIPDGKGTIFEKEPISFSPTNKTKSSLFSCFNLKSKRRETKNDEHYMKFEKKDNSIPYTIKNKFGLEPTELNYKCSLFNNQQQFNNQFFLKPGQFTDDTSMALCLADSLIYSSSITQSIYLENESLENVMQEMKNASKKFDDKEVAIDNSKSDTENVALNCFDGRDLRCRFVCWWNQGYNNSFRFDDTRLTRQSIGLGGNIGTSLQQINQAKTLIQVPPTYRKDEEVASNGSIMRLAPVAIRFSKNLDLALEVAKQQSEATHPGVMVTDASRFLAFILVKAVTRHCGNPINSSESKDDIKSFLDSSVEEYLAKYEEHTDTRLVRLLKASERSNSLEENWNWRAKYLPLAEVCKRRWESDPSHKYNGFLVSLCYFGSYAPDGLAVALFSAYNTTNFDDAIQLCINHLGDADTTGAICGQICGAFYGFENINPILRRNLSLWDRNEIALRAVLLYSLQQFD